jgi:DNA-binding NarL/FixJ family response regulator
MNRPRVIVADDSRLLREAFAALLKSHCDIVGGAADGRALLEMAPALKPDAVVLEVALSRLSGLDAGPLLKKVMPQVKLIFLTASDDPAVATDAFRAGASGFLLKNSAGSELLLAVREVIRGRVYITPLAKQGRAASAPDFRNSRKSTSELSPRRLEVLRLLADGRSMKQVARALKVTPRTVAFHKYGMMEQLGVRTSANLIRYAIRRQLISA